MPSGGLENGGEALPSADAHGFEQIPAARAHEVPRCGGQDAGAGGSHGMTERNPGPVDVDAFPVRGGEVPLAGDGKHLGANASLSSMRSMSLIASPERSNALATAGTGPSPMRDGSTPARAQVTSRTRGVSPS